MILYGNMNFKGRYGENAMTDKELQNRKRCLKCKYYGRNVCPLMANGDVFNLDVCILDIINKKNWNENSPEMFMFRNNPTLLLSYLSFLRKDKLPKTGDKVITLRSGFNGYGGNIRYVSRITDKYIEIVYANFDDETNKCCLSKIDTWYKDLFIFDDNN